MNFRPAKVHELPMCLKQQDGATYGPRATSGPAKVIFLLESSRFDFNVARETQIMKNCGPQTEIVARSWFKM